MSYCDPIEYIYDDNLDTKTEEAHKWINSYEEDVGCERGPQKFERGVRYASCEADLFVLK